jgi:hypothetical protein
MKSRKIASIHARLNGVAAPAFRSAVQVVSRFSHEKLKEIIKWSGRGFLQHGTYLLAPLLRIFCEWCPIGEQGQQRLFDLPQITQALEAHNVEVAVSESPPSARAPRGESAGELVSRMWVAELFRKRAEAFWGHLD